VALRGDIVFTCFLGSVFRTSFGFLAYGVVTYRVALTALTNVAELTPIEFFFDALP